jgi:hypothetical protein
VSAAIRSAFAASVALAGATAIAVSPLAPLPDHAVPTFAVSASQPAVALAAASAPALGAIPYQILINQLGDAIALAPILFGSTAQCAVCLGPDSPPSPSPLPFTGYGAVGIIVGLLSSPVAFVNALSSTGNVLQALGAAALAVRTPITNTFLDLVAPRALGGFNLEGTFNRAFTALNDAVTGILAITAQALVTGPVTVVGGAVSAGQLFAATLASTGNFVQAASLSAQVMRAAVTSAVTDLGAAVHNTRAQVYTDLTSNAPALTAAATPAAAPKAARSAASTKPVARAAKAAGAAKRSAR